MPVSPIMLPGLWGWDSSSSRWDRTNYENSDIFNMSFVPALTNPNYQDTALSMRSALFDESAYADIFLTNTLSASNVRNTMHQVVDPWHNYPFCIDMTSV